MKMNVCSPTSHQDHPSKLLQLINGFRVSKVIFSACDLGVFDLLLRTQRPMKAVEVAQELGCSVDGMERLLDALVGSEILDVDTRDGTAFYSNTDEANLYLAKGSAKSLHNTIIYYSQVMYSLWNNLADVVREGKNQNEKTFSLPAEETFAAIYSSEEKILKFMDFMDSSLVLERNGVVTAFDLSGFKNIVDVGGCTGALARGIAKAYPSSTVTVLELPMVVEMAQTHFLREDDTITFQTGDFVSGELPVADLYILSRIIHDWPEEKSAALLQSCYRASAPGGGVLVVEAMLNEDRRGPIMANLFSLNMLVMAQGRERTASEYSDMLKKAGFQNIQFCRIGETYVATLATK